ncbi:response regulator transcription factor [bacterium]|nr:response regulator transcription factor [bacterium]
MSEEIKVLLVEDHTMTRLGLQMVLEKSENINVIGEAADGKRGVELAKELLPDVILMDIGLPVMDGIEATRRIKEQGLTSRILIFTSRESDDDVFEALKAGADGYIMKGADENRLISAITEVSSGIAWLDPAIAKLVLANVQKQKNAEQKSSTPNPLKYKEYNLTKREYEVLKLIADGLDNDQIAEKLVISESTAKAHVHNLLGKLYVEDKHKATVLAYKEGLV